MHIRISLEGKKLSYTFVAFATLSLILTILHYKAVQFSATAELSRKDQERFDSISTIISSRRKCSRFLELNKIKENIFEFSLYNKSYQRHEFKKDMDFEEVIVEKSQFETLTKIDNIHFGHLVLEIRHKVFKNQTLKKKVPMFLLNRKENPSCLSFIRKII